MEVLSRRETLVLTGHLCPKCNEFTELVESSEIYGTDFGLLYRCPTCHAYVGCHKGSLNAKGSVAGRNLRELRKAAHHSFDSMWKSGDMNREDAYAWLSKRLGIPRFLTHVGMFDEAQCRRTIELCKAYAKDEGIRRI